MWQTRKPRKTQHGPDRQYTLTLNPLQRASWNTVYQYVILYTRSYGYARSIINEHTRHSPVS